MMERGTAGILLAADCIYNVSTANISSPLALALYLLSPTLLSTKKTNKMTR